MDLAQLVALLGLATGSDAAAVLSAITALKAKAEAPPAATAPLSAAVATALGVAPTADEATALTAITTLKCGAGSATQVIAALQGQLAALTNKINGDELTSLVAQAVADHKLLPVQRKWATELGNKNIADLKSYLANAPKLLPGVGGQTAGIDPSGNGGAAALNAAQAEVLANMGVSTDAYAKVYGTK